MVKTSLNACPLNDAVIFTGNGVTGALDKFCRLVEDRVRVRNDRLASTGGNGSDGAKEDDVDVEYHCSQYFAEDRWGGCECTLCDVRLKNEACFRAHVLSQMHAEKYREVVSAPSASVESDHQPGSYRALFIVDPRSHHSSSLPFRELARRNPDHFRVVELKETACDFAFEKSLKEVFERESRASAVADNQHDQLEIFAVLCAASNVTGRVRPYHRLTQVVHSYSSRSSSSSSRSFAGCHACWDFAAYLPHATVDLNPRSLHGGELDAAFFSPHKFLGGPGASGVLAIKKGLLRGNPTPSVCGGGTVFYVSEKAHSFIQNPEEREEAGTPNVLADIRCGLAFRLHSHVLDPLLIRERESVLLQRMLERFAAAVPEVEILSGGLALGDSVRTHQENRLPILSFNIRSHTTKLYLHYNYVSALLNDVFGIQARGGCACAGPYAQTLLNLDELLNDKFESCLQRCSTELIRPGFVRLGLHYTMSDAEVDYVIRAVEWVASGNGDRLLSLYTFDVESGEWVHEDAAWDTNRDWLSLDLESSLVFGNCGGNGGATRSNPIAMLEKKLEERKRELEEGHAEGSKLATAGGQVQVAAESQAAVFDIHAALAAANQIRVPTKNRMWPVLDKRVADLIWFKMPQDEYHNRIATDIFGDELDTVQRPAEPIFEIISSSSKYPESSLLVGAESPSTAPSTTPVASSPAVSSDQSEDTPFLFDGIDIAEEEDSSSAPRPTQDLLLPKYAASALHPEVPRSLRNLVGSAVTDFDMIKPGDKLLLGLSGGKDSLTLLHILRKLQKSSPVKFELACATVDPMTPEYDPSPMVEYLEKLGVPYHLLRKPLIELAKASMNPKKPSICSFCARMKRGMLYTCMRENG